MSGSRHRCPSSFLIPGYEWFLASLLPTMIIPSILPHSYSPGMFVNTYILSLSIFNCKSVPCEIQLTIRHFIVKYELERKCKRFQYYAYSTESTFDTVVNL